MRHDSGFFFYLEGMGGFICLLGGFAAVLFVRYSFNKIHLATSALLFSFS